MVAHIARLKFINYGEYNMNQFLYRSILLFTLTISSAFAANVPFKQADFDQLLKQGKPVFSFLFSF